MSSRFERGREDGREDSKPTLEEYSPLADMLFPYEDEESVERRNQDYMNGYQAGANQRAAGGDDK